MKAFISYSHKDDHYLERLKVHLAPMRRDGIISEWTDHDILAGGDLDKTISEELYKSQIFIALVSPDYINSGYCYEIEFNTATQLKDAGKITIVPIIVEDCEWQKTPFGKLKALPKDGKAISTWPNENTAFLNVISEIRKLISAPVKVQAIQEIYQRPNQESTKRDYIVKKYFSEVDKHDFKVKSYDEILKFFKNSIADINSVDYVQAKLIKEGDGIFTTLLSNRANGQNQYLTISTNGLQNMISDDLIYQFGAEINPSIIQMDQSFRILDDEFNMYWSKSRNYMFGRVEDKMYSAIDVANEIWDNFISQVGIV
ncbi:toll/interleukin-1 receptor domain-containing protein [Chryseobacterium taklimakanense]|uniref:toll/interleukin-1 receptor domain-containing protein n=1 Tax=Chryseobacterium taklimakanense TaxID=536441 RepID=UPI000F5F977A|nr:toll/interleukin-1 receptor domain-containing protein [Chryseobacterium taklimakanense]AZI22721.1 toll/interleukin-1 receptor domain-containing protein [Chryseobacterium taklimakanense]